MKNSEEEDVYMLNMFIVSFNDLETFFKTF